MEESASAAMKEPRRQLMEKFNQFCQGLPLQQPRQAVNLLTKTLVTLQSSLRPTRYCFQVLESIAPILFQLARVLKNSEDIRQDSFKGTCEVVKEINALEFEYARSFLNLSMNYDRNLDDAMMLSKVAYSLVYGLFYLHRIQRACYSAYLVLPEEFWRTLHKFYRYAEAYGLSDYLCVIPTDVGDIAEVSPIQLYKQSLLLSAMNTYRLTREELSQIEANLEEWQALTQINRPYNRADLFVIGLNDDFGPAYQVMGKTLAVETSCSFDTSTLAERLLGWKRNTSLAASNTIYVGATGFNLGLIQKILQSLNQFNGRKHPRLPSQGKIICKIGINENALQPISTRQTAWELVNISHEGFCIESKDEFSRQIQPGQMLSLQSLPSKPWQIGVVRWLQYFPTGVLRVGVQLLSPEGVEIKVKNRQKTTTETGLLLRETLQDLGPVLILNSKQFNRGDIVHITQQDREDVFEVDRLLESNALSTHYVLTQLRDRQAQ